MSIPVLEDYDMEFDEFVDTLVKWSEKWVDEIATKVCKSASELYKNKAIVLMLKDWKFYTERYESKRVQNLYSLAKEGKPYFLYHEEDLKWDKDQIFWLSDILRSLLIG